LKEVTAAVLTMYFVIYLNIVHISSHSHKPQRYGNERDDQYLPVECHASSIRDAASSARERPFANG
jgi:hypothetical protein